MAIFRRFYCTESTADTLCMVPYHPNNRTLEMDWCMEYYGTTQCSEIRDEAQNETFRFLVLFYHMNAIWGIGFVAVVRVI